ncbi:MAG: response regulator transcription factor [Christensenellaceae bacterium]|jgi:DNA-binding response OmpR family regulator|nr:response regulator transcription factor [Christensenellaceae bacterium]
MPQVILMVEDDPHIAQVVSEYLKEAGYIVLSAPDGQAARNLLESEREIDAFILDIMLPAVSGLELLRMLREREIYRESPVMMLSALGDETTQLLSFDALADDYVTKPFSPKVLVRRMQALLRRAESTGSTMEYEDIVLDNDSYEVTDNGEKVKLTLREFELLKALMANAKKVLTRQQLLNYAWGYDFFGDERIVDVHIKNLRKKLRSPIIATIKGVGYKLERQEEETP